MSLYLFFFYIECVVPIRMNFISNLMGFSLLGVTAFAFMFNFWERTFSKYFVFGSFFGSFLYLGVRYSPIPSYAMGTFLTYGKYFMFTACICLCIENEDDLIRLFKLLVGATAFMTLYSFLFLDLGNMDVRFGYEENAANPNNLVNRTLLPTFMSIYMILNSKKGKFFYIVCTVAIIILNFATGSKKAIITIPIFLMLNVILMRGQKDKRIIKIFEIILGITILIYCIQVLPMFSLVKERFSTFIDTIFRDSGEVSIADLNRKRFIEEAFRMFLERPLSGYGLAATTSVFGTYSHNNYVEILANNGIFVFLYYYGFIIYLIKQLGKRLKLSKDKICAFFINVLLCNLIIDVSIVSYNILYSMLIIALSSKWMQLHDEKYAKKGEEQLTVT